MAGTDASQTEVLLVRVLISQCTRQIRCNLTFAFGIALRGRDYIVGNGRGKGGLNISYLAEWELLREKRRKTAVESIGWQTP